MLSQHVLEWALPPQHSQETPESVLIYVGNAVLSHIFTASANLLLHMMHGHKTQGHLHKGNC